MKPPSTEQLASSFLAVIDSIVDGQTTRVPFRLSMLSSVTMVNDEMAVAAAQHLVNQGQAYWAKTENDEIAITPTRVGLAHIRNRMGEPPASMPPPNITSITHSTIGGIQQGTTNSVQKVDQTADLSSTEVMLLRAFLVEAESKLDELDDEERGAASQHLATLAEELKSENPRRDVISSALSAVRDVSLGIVASGTWQAIQQGIQHIWL